MYFKKGLGTLSLRGILDVYDHEEKVVPIFDFQRKFDFYFLGAR